MLPSGSAPHPACFHRSCARQLIASRIQPISIHLNSPAYHARCAHSARRGRRDSDPTCGFVQRQTSLLWTQGVTQGQHGTATMPHAGGWVRVCLHRAGSVWLLLKLTQAARPAQLCRASHPALSSQTGTQAEHQAENTQGHTGTLSTATLTTIKTRLKQWGCSRVICTSGCCHDSQIAPVLAVGEKP